MTSVAIIIPLSQTQKSAPHGPKKSPQILKTPSHPLPRNRRRAPVVSPGCFNRSTSVSATMPHPATQPVAPHTLKETPHTFKTPPPMCPQHPKKPRLKQPLALPPKYPQEPSSPHTGDGRASTRDTHTLHFIVHTHSCYHVSLQ